MNLRSVNSYHLERKTIEKTPITEQCKKCRPIYTTVLLYFVPQNRKGGIVSCCVIIEIIFSIRAHCRQPAFSGISLYASDQVYLALSNLVSI